MNLTEQTIINTLRRGPIDSHNLAVQAGVARASVRRSIQQLRRAGWNISYGTPSYFSRYKLHTPEQTAQVATA